MSSNLGPVQGHPSGSPALGAAARRGPFDLDVSVVEAADAGSLISVTDDGCGTTCPKACTTGSR
ncbi:FxLD family lantipeptide [Microbispora triticiradicis]|uniref:FxLD family lantipeptide n=3 Tax=Microbispora TaxID=2005 RepID=A0ABY3LSL3_9ACTN|nr:MULTISPECIES: FxLD family lanthipeptide [Microbispora]RGA05562.1 FxLD family lantipeptide [Microbispora triticiradicis]TLP57846.1 FxLD family lantipeptide [Microbispora fusca]TYB52314.1 FxLD family lantipeptide [Microbispora tritici]